MTAPRLTIIVPYRDRAQHLSVFLPGLARYFERDKADHVVPYRVMIVEQASGLPFNRGAMKNIGFIMARDCSDYVCFHDVDYLPIWADYSYCEQTMPIAWYGALTRPVSSRSKVTLFLKDADVDLFGAVVLCPVEAFAKVNGYANSYWGWGMEDTDLRFRFNAAAIPCGRRKGTFQPLFHDSHGYYDDGSLNPEAKANQEIFERRWPRAAPHVASDETRTDGLSSVRFSLVDKRDISDQVRPERPAIFEKVTVRLDISPTPEQRAAHASMKSIRV